MSSKDINMNLNYVMTFILFAIMVILYTRYIYKREIEINDPSILDAMKEFMINDCDKDMKTMLWIHVPREINARSWKSFYGRNSNGVNMPFIYLCIRSIVESCGKCFQIMLIDDTSFGKLLSDWEFDLSRVGSPLKEKLRYLGLSKLLYEYGGLVLPKSFLCMKNLMPLYQEGCSHQKPFVAERIIGREHFTCNHQFIGCIKNCPTMKKFIDFQENLNGRDYTDQSIFLKQLDKWIYSNLGKFNIIDGKKIGIKNKDNKPINLEDLFGEKHLQLACFTSGILIPEDELCKRNHYNWFCYLNEKQILDSNMVLSKYFLMSRQK